MPVRDSITFVPNVHLSLTHRRRIRETTRAEAPDLVAIELNEFRFGHFDRDRRPTTAASRSRCHLPLRRRRLGASCSTSTQNQSPNQSASDRVLSLLYQ
jgi:hypothetical protein